LTADDSGDDTIGSYFLYDFKLKPYVNFIRFKYLGTGRRLSVALAKNFSDEILRAQVIIKDSRYIVQQQEEAMDKASWVIERDTLRRQGLDWARARTQYDQTVADLERRLQHSDATLTIERSQLQRSRADNSELSNANRELIAANTALHKQVDELLWFAILAVSAVVFVAFFRGRQRSRKTLALARENMELGEQLEEKDRHIADLVDNLATLMSRSGT
jgi:hypothetical protein